MITEEFHFSRRNLPHWQQGGSNYFITFRSAKGVLPEEALRFVKDHILSGHNKFYTLYFGVIMPDHVHVMLQPAEITKGEWIELSIILKGIKRPTAEAINNLLGTSGKVWQEERFDRMIRDDEEFKEKWQYMFNNPIKAGLVSFGEEYEFYLKP